MEINSTNSTRDLDQDFKTRQSGYDLPVYGIENQQFYALHIPALVCIFVGLCSAVAVLIVSFTDQSFRKFYSWTRSQRFVVYLAFCDGLFNIAHTLDHMHILLTRDHVYPKELCVFYGLMLLEFISAQVLMVNMVAINAFVLIYFRKQINYGRWDWRLLAYTFGVPFAAGILASVADTLGPNGAFCYFDGVKGEIANILFTTIPLLAVLVVNTIMYVLTWQRIHSESKHLKDSVGRKARSIKASHKAAQTMSLFVLAFFIQWWAMGLYGGWQLLGPVPTALFQFVTTFSNVGGLLNGIVFIIIRRRTRSKTNESTNDTTDSSKATSAKPSRQRNLSSEL